MYIRILKFKKYFLDTREITIGDVFKVEKVGKSEIEIDDVRQVVNCYLFTSKNNKSCLAYENEVELLSDEYVKENNLI